MANDATNVIIGKPLASGGLLTAVAGTPLPTSATAPLNGAFEATGYVSEDGVVQTIDTDTTDIKAWGGDVVRTVETAHDVTYKFTMIEHNGVTLGAYYGDDNYTPGAIEIRAGELPRKPWVIEIKDGDARGRIVVPIGQIVERGDVNYTDEDAAGFEVTLKAFPDSTGVKAYIYWDGLADEDSVPVIASATPATSGTAGGALVSLFGNHFTGATAVRFGGTNATSFLVIDDEHIAAVTPAKTAGSQPATVVTPAGTSNALPFTYA